MPFERYSRRAARVMLLARAMAGRRGGDAVELGDLLAALIVEDQGRAREELLGALSPSTGPAVGTGAARPASLLKPGVAEGLRSRLGDLLPQSEAVPRQREMPISEALIRALESASSLALGSGQGQVEPAHLMAACLADESDTCAEQFRLAGVTSERVLTLARGVRSARPRAGSLPQGLTAQSLRRSCSQRALDVLFLARIKATERGSKEVGAEDVLAAILIEDQGNFERAVIESPCVGIDVVDRPPPRPRHRALMPRDVARRLLDRLEGSLRPAGRSPRMGGVAFSLAVRQALAVANGIRAELGHERINPSHLLAALAGRGSGKGVQALRDAGITEEGVLELIRQQQQGE